MTKTLKIAGMNCEHCAAKVRAALEGITEVTAVSISVEGQSATVELSGEVSDSKFDSAVEESGYHFDGIE